MDLSSYLVHEVMSFLWPFCRIAAMISIMVVLGTRLVSVRIRLLIALAITFAVYKHIPNEHIVTDVNFDTLIVLLQETIIGFALGFITLFITQVFVISGQLIAMQSGLGFASMNDPQNGVAVPTVSQFYLMMVTLIFLAINGHLVMIEIVTMSFTYLPMGQGTLTLAGLDTLLATAKYMYIGGVLMSLPAVVALLLVNIGFGVMTKAAPQLNIMSVGFPITITLGLSIMYLTMPILVAGFNSIYREVLDASWYMINAQR